MSTYTPEQLSEILDLHAKWLRSGPTGQRADLTRANLAYAYLTRADLTDAYLTRANLYGADLTDADLTRANLAYAILTRADLTDAYLTRADLTGADLTGADLRGADLTGADLTGADLTRANLYGADLTRANLTGANLTYANLTGAKLPAFSHCPEEGQFIAYKKLAGGVVAKLQVPAKAKRASSLVGRKCRAEYVKVLSLSNGATEARSKHDTTVVYRVGEIVRPDSYDDDIRVECTHGIHFFITRKEAEDY